MDLLLKVVAQFPLVALFVYIWYTSKIAYEKELQRLHGRIRQVDEELYKMTATFDRLNLTLELIKDRLR